MASCAISIQEFHLVNVHEEREDDIDEFESHVDGTTGRGRPAEERHRVLHLAPLPASSE